MAKRVFKNFQEFYSLTRTLNESQKDKLYMSLSPFEKASLERSCRDEGWEDLFITNRIDGMVDKIKEEHKEDLIYIRIQVLSGRVKKIRKDFWTYVMNVFSSYSIRHTWNIFEGIKAIDMNDGYVVLMPSKRRTNGKEIKGS